MPRWSVGVTATVKALEQIILHGRKEVEGSAPWKPHRPERPAKKTRYGSAGLDATDFVAEPATPRANRLAAEFNKLSSACFFEVDPNLRPEGRSGALAQRVVRAMRPLVTRAKRG